MSAHRVSEASVIEAVLTSPRFAPPPREGDGSTLALRRAMARFAAPSEHPERRAAVLDALGAVAFTQAIELATVLTARRLSAPRNDASSVSQHVAVCAIAGALGLCDCTSDEATSALVQDVAAVVAVIGRGDQATVETDASTARLLSRAAEHPAGAVPVVSLLYQSHDATAAWVTTSLLARETRSVRVPAVPRTVRMATETCEVGGIGQLTPGAIVTLELGRAGMEFGAGPHACPGRELAQGITDAIIRTIEQLGYQPDMEALELDEDGKPRLLPLRQRHFKP